MKKIMFLFVVSLFFVSAGNSQDEKTLKPFRLGILGSTNISWFNPSSEWHKNDGTLLRFGYGLTLEIALGDDNYLLAIGLESPYSGGNLKWDSLQRIVGTDTSFVKVNSVYKFQHLEFPLVLKLRTNEISNMIFFAKFGGSFNVRIDAKADYEYIGKVPYENQDAKKYIEFFRIAFVVGVGMEYSLGGSTSAVLGFNFNNGLTNIFTKEKCEFDIHDKKAMNNYVSINLGIIF